MSVFVRGGGGEGRQARCILGDVQMENGQKAKYGY